MKAPLEGVLSVVVLFDWDQTHLDRVGVEGFTSIVP